MPSWGSRAALLRVFRNGVPALTPVAGFTRHPQAGQWTPRPRVPNYRLLGKPMTGVLWCSVFLLISSVLWFHCRRSLKIVGRRRGLAIGTGASPAG